MIASTAQLRFCEDSRLQIVFPVLAILALSRVPLADMDSGHEYRPGFFEVYAANHLSSALRPALRFALEVLSVRHPFLIRIANRSDEIFTALLLLLETSQLQKESALLAESFYSLRRSTNRNFRPNNPFEVPLQRKHTVLSILFGVVLPYAKAKLDAWHSDATGGAAASLFVSNAGERANPIIIHRIRPPISNLRESGRSSSRASVDFNPVRYFARFMRSIKEYLSSERFRTLVLRWYPRVSTCCESTNLIFHILYLFGRTRFFSLALVLQGLVLRRTSPVEELRSMSRKTSFFTEGSRRIQLSQFISALSERIITVFRTSFFLGIFAFRFLQYYYAAEVGYLFFLRPKYLCDANLTQLLLTCMTFSRQRWQASVPRESGPIIPPPEPLLPAAGVDRKTALASKSCPLCHSIRVNPTACVSLYNIDFRHHQSSQKCLPFSISYFRLPLDMSFAIFAYTRMWNSLQNVQ